MNNMIAPVTISFSILAGIFTYAGATAFESLTLSALIQIIFLLMLCADTLMRLHKNLHSKFIDESGK